MTKVVHKTVEELKELVKKRAKEGPPGETVEQMLRRVAGSPSIADFYKSAMDAMELYKPAFERLRAAADPWFEVFEKYRNDPMLTRAVENLHEWNQRYVPVSMPQEPQMRVEQGVVHEHFEPEMPATFDEARYAGHPPWVQHALREYIERNGGQT